MAVKGNVSPVDFHRKNRKAGPKAFLKRQGRLVAARERLLLAQNFHHPSDETMNFCLIYPVLLTDF